MTNDDAFMVLAGVRYCLGRHSYAPSLCCDWLKLKWPTFAEADKAQIVRAIQARVAEDGANESRAGIHSWETDLRTWRDFLEWQARPPFRTGDVVQHGPTGERWVISYAEPATGYLSWLGSPDGEAKIADCILVEAVSDEEHHTILRNLIKAGGFRAVRARRLYGDPPSPPALPTGADA